MEATAASPKLGVTYNAFDGVELLEASIRSVRSVAKVVVVVHQAKSNFGRSQSKEIGTYLEFLKKKKLIDKIITYQPRKFNAKQKKLLISDRATGIDFAGARPEEIGDQFFNELRKREIGRQALLEEFGCTHFISADVDEMYVPEQLKKTFDKVISEDLDMVVCKMRNYCKDPRWELVPYDETNYVPVICKCRDDMYFALVAPYPVLIDPTRRVSNVCRLHCAERSELEMHHFSLVRMDIVAKVQNVSNHGNYTQVHDFLAQFQSWTPATGTIIHPHPFYREMFTDVDVHEKDQFGIDVSTPFKARMKE